MSNESEENASRLAPLTSAYDPTEADAERVFAKIEASLAAGANLASPTAARAEPAPAAATGAGGKKALFVGMSCAAIAIVGAMVLRNTDSRTAVPQPRVEAASVGLSAPSSERRDPDVMAAIPSVSVDALPSAAVQPVSRPGVNVAPVPVPVAPEPDADTLEREARILADARRARQAGDAEVALVHLDQHAREFPSGWLASDRRAERIVVLCALGRRDEAVREAAVFLKGRPKGPLTRRVEMSCAGLP